jgi:hypothetical protein
MELGVFGPYRAQVSNKPPTTSSQAASPGTRLVGLDQITSKVEKVIVKLRNQSTQVELEGDKWDAIFWNLPAVDKFVIPYYVQHEGLEKGGKVRSEFLDPAAYMLAHAPNTDYKVLRLTELRVDGETKFMFLPIR